ncbi:MAG: helix-turn-helix transcriptional regulator, partial [Cyanobacteria bacterium Co-bin8]|nr:helix-turn-helix transcriptional regulator [Cyanobacteria bacterium Co-bin8]
MTITFQPGELRQLLREHTQSQQPKLLANDQDATLMYPEWLGSGHKRDIELPSGISLTLHQYQLNEDLVNICLAEDSSCCEFVFNLSAHSQYGSQHTFTDQHVHLCGPQWEDARWCEFAGQDYLAVDIHIDTPALASLLSDPQNALPPALQQLFEGRCQRPFLDPLAITPAMLTALWQILKCPYQGLTQKLYLESKSLELIALFIESLQQEPAAHPSLQPEDIEPIRQAQQVLLQNLQTPPSLTALARQVGLNDRKLKAGFHQIANTTVFGYLTQLRMEKACHLLAQQQSIAAVAAAVGYASPTAFSGAFRRQFGIPPKAYQLT